MSRTARWICIILVSIAAIGVYEYNAFFTVILTPVVIILAFSQRKPFEDDVMGLL
jgi:hypothetical protein